MSGGNILGGESAVSGSDTDKKEKSASEETRIEKLEKRLQHEQSQVVYQKRCNDELSDRLRGYRRSTKKELYAARVRFDELREHTREQAQDIEDLNEKVLLLQQKLTESGHVLTKDTL